MSSNKFRLPQLCKQLDTVKAFVDWVALVEIIKPIDKTGTRKGGRPRIELEKMLRILFLQHMFSLSDPQTEEQLLDRLSFQRFVDISAQQTPDYSSIWRFKETLITHGLLDKIFDDILRQLEERELILRRGTIVDATLIQSSHKPLSQEKRTALEELAQNPETEAARQAKKHYDTDANSTKKGHRYYFGYKGHIGVDVGSKIIRKRHYSRASVHDSQHKLFVGDERSVFGDSAYSTAEERRAYRKTDIFYGVMAKPKRNCPLTVKQRKNHKKWSRVRSQVEHCFSAIKNQFGYRIARCRNISRNGLHFDFTCIVYNIHRGIFLVNKNA